MYHHPIPDLPYAGYVWNNNYIYTNNYNTYTFNTNHIYNINSAPPPPPNTNINYTYTNKTYNNAHAHTANNIANTTVNIDNSTTSNDKKINTNIINQTNINTKIKKPKPIFNSPSTHELPTFMSEYLSNYNPPPHPKANAKLLLEQILKSYLCDFWRYD